MVKIPYPRNAKQHYQSFIKRKNRKSVKQLKVITDQPKTFEKSNVADIKAAITEHPKTSHKLSKTIRQAEKVGSNSSLFSNTRKRGIFLNEKNVKITKQSHAFKDYASTYHIEFLNSFDLSYNLKILNMQLKVN